MSEILEKARKYEAAREKEIDPLERPVYHLSPRVGWMNDPNGFCFYKGQYHLFYQYHPYSLKWGPMHWGHAVSRDFLHWEYLPCALAPDTDRDSFGCFSGSAITMPDGRQMLLYTGVYEEKDDDGSVRTIQTQCAAFGDGVDYEKYEGNPVLDERDLPVGGSRENFRDPKIWQEPDGSYACVVGNQSDDGSGSLLLYRSADALHWQFDTILDRCYREFGKMWECPDTFELDGKKVILVSPQDMYASGLEFHNGNGTMCLMGTYDVAAKHFHRENIQAIDYGLDFYAPQTTLTPDGRRVMVAWMQNWDACIEPENHPKWFGQMTTPRELHIRDGALIQNPVRELEALRGRRVHHKVTICEETTLQGVCGRAIDMTVALTPVEGELYQQFRMKLARDSQHFTSIAYDPRTSILTIDRSHSGSRRDVVHERRCLVRRGGGAVKLRVLLDRFSIEIFVNNGEQALSTTIYTPQTANGISFEAQGPVELEVEKYDLSL